MPTSELRTYQDPPTHRLCATHSTATDPLQYHLLSAQIAVPAVPHASHVGTGVVGRRTCCDSAQQPCVRFTSAGRGRADVDPNGCGPPIAALLIQTFPKEMAALLHVASSIISEEPDGHALLPASPYTKVPAHKRRPGWYAHTCARKTCADCLGQHRVEPPVCAKTGTAALTGSS